MNTDSNNIKDFEAFMETRKKASTDFLEGNFDSLNALSVQQSPATLFSPKGIFQGAREVNSYNEKGSAAFSSQAINSFEVLHQFADEHLAYWVGIQRSHVKMKGKDDAVPFNLRVTELFRKEGGQWKLFHRHADEIKEV